MVRGLLVVGLGMVMVFVMILGMVLGMVLVWGWGWGDASVSASASAFLLWFHFPWVSQGLMGLLWLLWLYRWRWSIPPRRKLVWSAAGMELGVFRRLCARACACRDSHPG